MAIWRMRITCWINKTTDTHSEYVILIAFPQQQWLHGLASMLRYTYIACPVSSIEVCNFNTSDKECVFVFIGFLQTFL